MAPVIWALLLLGCGPDEPPGFETWTRDALTRCHPAATSEVHCKEGPCLAIVRTPSGEELDVKGCMSWPYTGLGTQKRTQECGDTRWRLTAISQLPELEGTDVQAVLQAEAKRVAATLDATACP